MLRIGWVIALILVSVACNTAEPSTSPAPVTAPPGVSPTLTGTPTPAAVTETPSASSTPRASATPTPTARPAACRSNPAPADPADPSIVVSAAESPVATISPLDVRGRARAFEARLRARLLDASGRQLGGASISTSAGAPDFGDFDTLVGFDVAEPTPACLELVVISPRDGSPEEIYQQEVVLLPGAERAGGACPDNPAPPNVADPDITVDEPGALTRVSSPVTIAGNARVFEANLSVALLAPSGVEIAAGNLMASAGAPEMAPFSGQLAFNVARPTASCLRVYSRSPRDGSAENVVQAELLLLP